MKIIEREMQSKEHTRTHIFFNCQASFNSHGCSTLRNYTDKDKDEIICFDENETRAIIALFRQLKENNILPF